MACTAASHVATWNALHQPASRPTRLGKRVASGGHDFIR